MRLARVTGTVVSTRKEPTIVSVKLLLVQPITPDGTASGEPLVAADAVGAGIGHAQPHPGLPWPG